MNDEKKISEAEARANNEARFYKEALDSISRFITEHLHPDYGPCDGFADGNCSVCLLVIKHLKAAHALTEAADRIETAGGHLIQRSGARWYAYPKVDPDYPGKGGEVLYEDPGRTKLKKFASAVEAYAACVEARERHTQRPGAMNNGDANESAASGRTSP